MSLLGWPLTILVSVGQVGERINIAAYRFGSGKRRWPKGRRRRPSPQTTHFPVERDRADGAFDGVVDAAIIDEARQRERITDGVGKLALLDGAP
jgi:hypothetical protein